MWRRQYVASSKPSGSDKFHSGEQHAVATARSFPAPLTLCRGRQYRLHYLGRTGSVESSQSSSTQAAYRRIATSSAEASIHCVIHVGSAQQIHSSIAVQQHVAAGFLTLRHRRQYIALFISDRRGNLSLSQAANRLRHVAASPLARYRGVDILRHPCRIGAQIAIQAGTRPAAARSFTASCLLQWRQSLRHPCQIAARQIAIQSSST